MTQTLHQRVLEALPDLVRQVDEIALRYRKMWDEVDTTASMPLELSHAMEHPHYEPVEVGAIRSLVSLYKSALESGRKPGQHSELLEALHGVITAFPSPRLTEDGYPPEVVDRLRSAVGAFLSVAARIGEGSIEIPLQNENPPLPRQPDEITATEASQTFGIPSATIAKYVAKEPGQIGYLPSRKLGSSRLLKRSDVLKLSASIKRRQRSNPERRPALPPPGDEP